MYSEKVFKNSIKLLTTPFFVMLQTFFAQKALNGKLDIQEGTRSALGYSSTQSTCPCGYAGTWGIEPLRHSKGTCVLDTQGTLFRRLFKPRVEDWILFDSVYHPLLRGFQKALFEAHTILTSNKKHIKLSLGRCFPWLICEKLAPFSSKIKRY